MSASQAHVAQAFAQDGYVFPLDAMSEAAAGDYRAQLEQAEAMTKQQPDFRKCLRRYPNLVLPFSDENTRLSSLVMSR
jgi:type IV secretory pathway VirB9-like protein